MVGRFQAEEGMLTCPQYKDGNDVTHDSAAVYRNSGLERCLLLLVGAYFTACWCRYCDVTQLEATLQKNAERKRKPNKITRKVCTACCCDLWCTAYCCYLWAAAN